MNLKELKKLADACRKAGIKHFKSADYEFTLTDDAPVSAYKQSKSTSARQNASAPDTKFESDSLTQDELLFWSTGNPAEQSDSN